VLSDGQNAIGIHSVPHPEGVQIARVRMSNFTPTRRRGAAET
jgi:hypothetical protein